MYWVGVTYLTSLAVASPYLVQLRLSCIAYASQYSANSANADGSAPFLADFPREEENARVSQRVS